MPADPFAFEDFGSFLASNITHQCRLMKLEKDADAAGTRILDNYPPSPPPSCIKCSAFASAISNSGLKSQRLTTLLLFSLVGNGGKMSSALDLRRWAAANAKL
ncbi:hypothetical protein [Novosphingobium resinovorum]|uniref:hypothetical protein n=2 Tax=Sphingomonadaceae TaxID=41297 RepID=UPI003D2CCCA2